MLRSLTGWVSFNRVEFVRVILPLIFSFLAAIIAAIVWITNINAKNSITLILCPLILYVLIDYSKQKDEPGIKKWPVYWLMSILSTALAAITIFKP